MTRRKAAFALWYVFVEKYTQTQAANATNTNQGDVSRVVRRKLFPDVVPIAPPDVQSRDGGS